MGYLRVYSKALLLVAVGLCLTAAAPSPASTELGAESGGAVAPSNDPTRRSQKTKRSPYGYIIRGENHVASFQIGSPDDTGLFTNHPNVDADALKRSAHSFLSDTSSPNFLQSVPGSVTNGLKTLIGNGPVRSQQNQPNAIISQDKFPASFNYRQAVFNHVPNGGTIVLGGKDVPVFRGPPQAPKTPTVVPQLPPPPPPLPAPALPNVVVRPSFQLKPSIQAPPVIGNEASTQYFLLGNGAVTQHPNLFNVHSLATLNPIQPPLTHAPFHNYPTIVTLGVEPSRPGVLPTLNPVNQPPHPFPTLNPPLYTNVVHDIIPAVIVPTRTVIQPTVVPALLPPPPVRAPAAVPPPTVPPFAPPVTVLPKGPLFWFKLNNNNLSLVPTFGDFMKNYQNPLLVTRPLLNRYFTPFVHGSRRFIPVVPAPQTGKGAVFKRRPFVHDYFPAPTPNFPFDIPFLKPEDTLPHEGHPTGKPTTLYDGPAKDYRPTATSRSSATPTTSSSTPLPDTPPSSQEPTDDTATDENDVSTDESATEAPDVDAQPSTTAPDDTEPAPAPDNDNDDENTDTEPPAVNEDTTVNEPTTDEDTTTTREPTTDEDTAATEPTIDEDTTTTEPAIDEDTATTTESTIDEDATTTTESTTDEDQTTATTTTQQDDTIFGETDDTATPPTTAEHPSPDFNDGDEDKETTTTPSSAGDFGSDLDLGGDEETTTSAPSENREDQEPDDSATIEPTSTFADSEVVTQEPHATVIPFDNSDNTDTATTTNQPDFQFPSFDQREREEENNEQSESEATTTPSSDYEDNTGGLTVKKRAGKSYRDNDYDQLFVDFTNPNGIEGAGLPEKEPASKSTTQKTPSSTTTTTTEAATASPTDEMAESTTKPSTTSTTKSPSSKSTESSQSTDSDDYSIDFFDPESSEPKRKTKVPSSPPVVTSESPAESTTGSSDTSTKPVIDTSLHSEASTESAVDASTTTEVAKKSSEEEAAIENDASTVGTKVLAEGPNVEDANNKTTVTTVSDIATDGTSVDEVATEVHTTTAKASGERATTDSNVVGRSDVDETAPESRSMQSETSTTTDSLNGDDLSNTSDTTTSKAQDDARTAQADGDSETSSATSTPEDADTDPPKADRNSGEPFLNDNDQAPKTKLKSSDESSTDDSDQGLGSSAKGRSLEDSTTNEVEAEPPAITISADASSDTSSTSNDTILADAATTTITSVTATPTTTTTTQGTTTVEASATTTTTTVSTSTVATSSTTKPPTPAKNGKGNSKSTTTTTTTTTTTKPTTTTTESQPSVTTPVEQATSTSSGGGTKPAAGARPSNAPPARKPSASPDGSGRRGKTLPTPAHDDNDHDDEEERESVPKTVLVDGAGRNYSDVQDNHPVVNDVDVTSTDPRKVRRAANWFVWLLNKENIGKTFAGDVGRFAASRDMLYVVIGVLLVSSVFSMMGLYCTLRSSSRPSRL